MENLTEIVKRPNVHQTHFCDLVLLGNEGLEELNDKIDRFLKTKQHQDVGLNVSTKIDGSPAVICFSSFEGYPDNSICLKSFVNNSNNCLSSEDEINDRYGDRPEMAEKLKFCLELSHYIPAGEAWQGDCLFTQMDLKEQDINGIKYLTFHPNKIVYAFSEDNPNYSKVKNADFGIAFHTIYKDDGEGGKKQSFRVDPTRLNAPDNFYIMSPAIDTSNIKFDDDKINELYDDLLEAEKDLMYDQDYEDLVHNEAFMKYWNTYENASLADKKAVNINVDNLTEDLLDYIKDKKEKEFTKKLSTLKTDKGRQSATEKYNQELAELENIVSTNREVLLNMVKALNLAANIKMEMWKGYKNADTGVSTFYRSKTRGFFPASMEGIAMSDSDGNIVKIVDRSEFSSANRDPDIMAGWEHPEDLRESITILKDIRLNEDIQKILNVLNEESATKLDDKFLDIFLTTDEGDILSAEKVPVTSKKGSKKVSYDISLGEDRFPDSWDMNGAYKIIFDDEEIECEASTYMGDGRAHIQFDSLDGTKSFKGKKGSGGMTQAQYEEVFVSGFNNNKKVLDDFKNKYKSCEKEIDRVALAGKRLSMHFDSGYTAYENHGDKLKDIKSGIIKFLDNRGVKITDLKEINDTGNNCKADIVLYKNSDDVIFISLKNDKIFNDNIKEDEIIEGEIVKSVTPLILSTDDDSYFEHNLKIIGDDIDNFKNVELTFSESYDGGKAYSLYIKPVNSDRIKLQFRNNNGDVIRVAPIFKSGHRETAVTNLFELNNFAKQISDEDKQEIERMIPEKVLAKIKGDITDIPAIRGLLAAKVFVESNDVMKFLNRLPESSEIRKMYNDTDDWKAKLFILTVLSAYILPVKSTIVIF